MSKSDGKLTKREVVRRVASGLSMRVPAAAAAVEAVFECVVAALAEGRRCEFRDFGTFFVAEYKGVTARNPHHPETTFAVAPRSVVRFRPSRALRTLCASARPNRPQRGSAGGKDAK